MLFNEKLPHWLIALFRIALLGEIYPSIRAIAVGYNDKREVLIRYYLDRHPTDFDLESIEVVATNLDSIVGIENKIEKINVECNHFSGYIRDMDPLSGFMYARREYV